MAKPVSKNNSLTFVLDKSPVSEHVRDLVEDFKTAESGQTECPGVVLDFSKAEKIDSMGVTFLVGVCKSCEARSQPVKMVGASDELRELLKLMKLDSRLAG